MKFQLVLVLFIGFFTEVFSLNCYTCLNQPLDECIKFNQTCAYGMSKCFSMQKETISGGWHYSKFCAGQWYCDRSEAACEDLDEPEYNYLDCNVGCCTSDLCNHATGSLLGKSSGLLMFGILALLTLYFDW